MSLFPLDCDHAFVIQQFILRSYFLLYSVRNSPESYSNFFFLNAVVQITYKG